MDAELRGAAFTGLDGWAAQDHMAALAVFQRSCRAILDQTASDLRTARFGGSLSAWQEVARAGLRAQNARKFFETLFAVFSVHDRECPGGLFTGYFEPEAEGSLSPSAEFAVPIYRRPADLVAFPAEVRERSGLAYGRWVAGKAIPYFTRQDIEQGALAGQGLEIAWLRDWADAFFIHIQGSGRLRLRDGSCLRLSFAAKSGLPYTAIGGVLVARGALRREELSMQTIKRWMTAHPSQARKLMWENQSFIFFREAQLADPDLGALGAQQVQLTPRRSLAIDRSCWMLGTPVWLDSMVPAGDEGSMQRFRQLLVAQDTGSAIKGLARGDVYWGFGDLAGRIAGPMKSQGAMHVLLPHAVAAELGLPA
ncbi:MAG: murein transglycosylase A [Aestuariivirga sp.]|uniref:murein transglycosylase A n=1 Tax=Aestuariivirga sp. TaxID=2650926 RepID=UPI0038D1FB29